jgi:multiple sugar transport system ATP-binding protein
MVFQSYALYPHMSVYDNLCSGLKLQRLPKAQIDRRIAEVSQVLGLDELMQRKPAQLSGGQRQRTAVGRALVRRPDVFLLDEPLSNLDALLRERVRGDLKQLFATQAAPVVYVTHDQTEAMTLSTTVAVLNEGYVSQLDTPANIYDRPANLFVAGFVGSPQMNLLTLPCTPHHAILGDIHIPLPERIATAPSSIVLGIRPEHIRIAAPTDLQPIRGRVMLAENLGMHYLVSVCVGDNLILQSLVPSAVSLPDPIELVLPPDRLYWFDPDTTNAL